MPRHPTIAEAALQIISERGPQDLDVLAAEILKAGLTRAKDPRRAVSAALEFHPEFLSTVEGRWYSIAAQLEGAIFTRRLTAFERYHGVVVLDDDLSLVERFVGRRRPFARGGYVRLDVVDHYFNLPWLDDGDPFDHDDELLDDPRPGQEREVAGVAGKIAMLEEATSNEAAMQFLADIRYMRLLSGPPGWLPLLDRRLLGIMVRGGVLDTVALVDDDVRGPDVGLTAGRIAGLARRVLGPDPSWFGPATMPLEELILMVVFEAPDLLRRPLPPLAEVLELGGLEVSGGRVAHRGTDWQSLRWEVPQSPGDTWGFDRPDAALDVAMA